MRDINQRNDMKEELDLREWWEEVENGTEAYRRISWWEKGPFFWYDAGKWCIFTYKDGSCLFYNVSETSIMLPPDYGLVEKKTWKKVLNALKKYELKLNTEYRVEDSAEAYRRAKAWEKGKYWFVSEDGSVIRTMDFSGIDISIWEKPVMVDYPINETSITYDTVEM